MIGGILLLAIVVFGLGILFGKGKVENYYKFLIWLIFAPVLFAIGFNHMVWFWLGLPLWAQILGVLLAPFLVWSLLRLLLPNAKWLQDLQALIFQTVLYAITFPVRLLWRAGRLILERERHRVRLNAYRPVVGSRPPIVREPSERR